MKTLATIVITAAITALLVATAFTGQMRRVYQAGVNSATLDLQKQAVNRGNAQWARDNDIVRFQWITRKHSSQRDTFPNDYFIANDEALASR